MEATILCYHKVGSASEEGRRLNIEPSRLRSHVRFFSRKKFDFLRVGDLSSPWKPGIVCFTFDDAYESTMFHAPQIFDEVGGKATFYAVSNRVGGTSAWDADLARPLANWDVLRSVQSGGHEIGNHTANHIHLDRATASVQLQEVRSAHERLLSEGIQPLSFCYPYGSYNASAVEQVGLVGYKTAVILGKSISQDIDKRLELPRIVVAYSDTLPMLLYKLKVKPLLKRLKTR